MSCFLLSALQLSGKLGLSLTHFFSVGLLLTLELFCKLFLRFLYLRQVIAACLCLLGVPAPDFIRMLLQNILFLIRCLSLLLRKCISELLGFLLLVCSIQLFCFLLLSHLLLDFVVVSLVDLVKRFLMLHLSLCQLLLQLLQLISQVFDLFDVLVVGLRVLFLLFLDLDAGIHDVVLQLLAFIF